MKGGSTAEAADSKYKGYDLLPSGTHLPLVWQLLHWQEQPGSQFEQITDVDSRHIPQGKMPGHVKKGGKQEADPDPSPWLVVSNETRKEDLLKPYDAKKSVWVPDGEGGFDEAMIESVEGDKVHVKVGWEPKTYKSEQVIMILIGFQSSKLDMFVVNTIMTKVL